jgi:hypothetical protein
MMTKLFYPTLLLVLIAALTGLAILTAKLPYVSPVSPAAARSFILSPAAPAS